jgi:HAD superfamily hydrolase (TIGR01450 family)
MPIRVAVQTLASLIKGPPVARGYLIDLDGTLVSGSAFLPGAVEFLSTIPVPFVILSNDSEHTPHQIASVFRKAGVPVGRRDVVLSGAVGLETIAAQAPGSRVLLMASPALSVLAQSLGLISVMNDPDIVFVARDPSFNYVRLAAAAKAVSAGARVVLASPDTSHPGPDGEPVPEAGAIAAALFACTGEVPHEVVGKPGPALFTIGCDRLGLAPDQCVMIGDNPATDGVGAMRVGMPFCQVATRAGSTATA